MESTKDNFLSWIEISGMVDNGEKLNPIDRFIYDNSPADFDKEQEFRDQLFEAVGYENEETQTERNAEIISAFMEFCKGEGYELPDTLFEDYFDA